MKTNLTLIIFLMLVFLGDCTKNSTSLTDNQEIQLYSDQTTYQLSNDTINISLENHSDNIIELGLRCNAFLEMEYQKYENDVWSDAISYLFILCPTFPDTLKIGDTYSEKLETDIFNSKDTYRFLLNIYIPEMDSTKYIYSNSFKLE